VRLAAVVVVLAALAGCDWMNSRHKDLHEYVYEDAGFAIQLAREPSELHNNPPFVTLMTIFPSSSYRVDYTPADFKGTADGLAALKKQYPDAHDITVPGAEAAFEANQTINGMHLRLRDILANGHLYQVITGGKDFDESDAASFYATFRLLPPKAKTP
jgi:hypothetical protein